MTWSPTNWQVWNICYSIVSHIAKDIEEHIIWQLNARDYIYGLYNQIGTAGL